MAATKRSNVEEITEIKRQQIARCQSVRNAPSALDAVVAGLQSSYTGDSGRVSNLDCHSLILLVLTRDLLRITELISTKRIYLVAL